MRPMRYFVAAMFKFDFDRFVVLKISVTFSCSYASCIGLNVKFSKGSSYGMFSRVADPGSFEELSWSININ